MKSSASTWSNIPPAIREIPQWVNFRVEKTSRGKLTKSPYRAGFKNRRASTTDRETWSTFEAAIDGISQYDGIGWVVTEDTGIILIDLDHSIAADGKIAIWARRIVDRVSSYAERSPNDGIHIIASGNLPPGARKCGSVEMYSEGRFFTFTGNHIEGTPTTVEGAEIGWLHRLMSTGVFNFDKS